MLLTALPLLGGAHLLKNAPRSAPRFPRAETLQSIYSRHVNTERPIVDLKSIVFDPDKMTFTLSFARGGSATIKLDTIDQERMILDVAMSGDAPKTYPFASMRSMACSRSCRRSASEIGRAPRTTDESSSGTMPTHSSSRSM